jgi:formylglycine-generating enzyme required for sulfatase activity
MVTTHNYLAESGGSGIYGSGTGQRGYTAQANIGTWGDRPDTNRPLDVFNAIVKPFNQVYMVICGHNFATYNLVKTNNFGKEVHEVVVDWQSLPNGGNGFLRIMEFQSAQNRIVNTSYSPYLGRYIDPNNNADHQGMLDLHDRNGSEFNLTTDFDTRFNTNLTIASIPGGVTPAVGTYSIEIGTPVAITADDVVTGQTRYRPTGWNLTGGQTASGSGSSGTFTQGADATLTWNYSTQHYLTTTTVGDGIVSTNGGWYDAGALVNIQAQPDSGATFTQWTGDIVGCTVNGATISVPVDRPRGPITAQFSSALPTYDVQIVSAYPDVSPAPSTYTYEQGQTVTFTASAAIPGSDTRRVCTGYTLTGAVSQSGSETSVTLPITGNMTLTWNWRTQYLLTTAASGPGTVSDSQWVDENSAATASATADPGAGFTSWTGDTTLGTANGTQFEIAAMTRPVGPLTANFATGSVTLTVVSPQATTIPQAGVYSHPYGTTVDFSALAAETNGSRQRPTGWILSGATSASGSTASSSVTILGDTTLTWTFAPEVLLSVSGGSEGAVLPMNTAGWYALGANLSLQATTLSPAFTFRQWTGDVPANFTGTSLALVMDQPRTVTADFAPVSSEGTPNWWLDAFTNVSGSDYLAARGNDSDGDGQPAWLEFIAGMSDLDSRDLFKVDAFSIDSATNTLHFTLPMRDLRVYQLMESVDLAGGFTPLGAPMQPVPPLATFSIPNPADARHFYRIDVSLGATGPADADPAAASTAPLSGSVVREMATIPVGLFIQGENSGPSTTRPEHVTHIARFKMDKFEVTRADWESVATWAQSHGYDIPVTLQYNQAPYNVPADHPAVAVSWYDAVKWCNARSEMEGRRPVYFTDALGTAVYRSGQSDLTSANVNWAGDGYRLPTESEWERASRGGIEQAEFPWGNEDGNLRANHWDYQIFNGRAPAEDYPYTEKVGFFDGTQPGGAPNMANAFGLHDMAGNAWEWTWDRMGDYPADTQYDPRGPDTGTQRIQRGGSWWNYVDQANNYQRLPFPPDGTDDYGMIGFRCVRAMHPNE